MRVYYKIILLFTALLITTNAWSDVIKQSFYPTFGPDYSSTTVGESEDNWSFVYLKMEGATKNLFNGSTIVLQSASGDNGIAGHVTSPQKQGGVGMVSFWWKPQEANTYIENLNYEIELQTSTDGENFTTRETFSLPASDATYHFSSVTINDLQASYVRLELKKHASTYTYINLDEIIITDAIENGTPARVTLGKDIIEGEVGESTLNYITVNASHAANGLTLSLKEGTVFTLSESSVPASDSEETYQIPILFTPTQKNITTDTLYISGSGIPQTIFPLSGNGLEYTIVEGFNSDELPNWSGTFNYEGWEIIDGSKTTDTNQTYEGESSLKFYSSIISPAKLGGIGEVTFVYRAENTGYDLTYRVSTSKNGANWNIVDEFTVSDTQYKRYHKTINQTDTVKYLKIENKGGGGSYYTLIIDALVITEYDQTIPLVTVSDDLVFTTTESTEVFQIPLNFSNITAEVKLAIDQEKFTLNQTTISAAEANGSYHLPLTFTDTENRAYVSGNLTISGGGMYFPEQLSISVYKEVDHLFTDFDGNWGSTSVGNYITDMGWSVNNGSRETYNTAFGSAAAVTLSVNGNILSPAKKSGVGSVQFYAKASSSGNAIKITIYTSTDGIGWKEEEAIDCNNTTFTNYETEINDPNAKYVKLVMTADVSYTSLYLDNITITANGIGIPKISQANEVLFGTEKGIEQQLNFPLKIQHITSDVQVKLNSGNVFAINGSSTISPADVQEDLYNLPMTFKSDVNGYFTDSLILSGDDFNFDQIIPIKGYILQPLLYQDFSNRTTSVDANNQILDGWEIFMGSITTGINDIYTGSGALMLNSNPSGNGYLLSIPKSNGVGTVSFYYKSSASYALNINVLTYETLDSEPSKIGTINVSSTPQYTLYEVKVDNPEARYVKLEMEQFEANPVYLSAYIDHLIITENGKGIPEVKAPETIIITNQANNPSTEVIEIEVANVEEKIYLSLSNGSLFSLNSYEFNPEEPKNKLELSITYQPDEESYYNADTITINSDGLLKPITIIVEGHILRDKLFQGFNAEGWAHPTTAGDAYLEGWYIQNAVRESIPIYIWEGESAVRMMPSNTKNASLRSPAKSGGIGNVEFYYRTNAPISFEIQSSENGNDWVTVDEITTPSSMTEMEFYQNDLKDSKAKFLRINSGLAPYGTAYFAIDSIAIEAIPQIQLAKESSTIELTKAPSSFEVEVMGYLNSEATLGLLEGANSLFSLETTTISPVEIAEGNTTSITLTFKGAEKADIYYDAIIVNNDQFENPIYLPVIIDYQPSSSLPENETTIIELDFETEDQSADWIDFDLDGFALSFFFPGSRVGWFISDEIGNPENTVFAASSAFESNSAAITYPADDWLFSTLLTVPENGAFAVEWEAKSAYYLFLEDYEIRVIEEETFQRVQKEFIQGMPLSEIAEILANNSDLHLTVIEESEEWAKHSITLNSYRGKQVRVIWRHISDDRYALYIDNFRYYSKAIDANFTAIPDKYTQIPEFALESFDHTVQAIVDNGTDMTLTNMDIQFNILNKEGVEKIYSQSFPFEEFSAYQSFELENEYTIEALNQEHIYQIEVTSQEEYFRTITTEVYPAVNVTDSTYAWDNGNIEGGVYSSSEGFQIGQLYSVLTDSHLTSITFQLTESTTATQVNVHIYEMDGSERKLIQSITSVPVKSGVMGTYTAELPGESILLEKDKTYFFSLEQKNGENLYLAKTDNKVNFIAAYYTKNNASWITLGNDHTLVLRINVQKEKKVNVVKDNFSDQIVVKLTRDGQLYIQGAEPGSQVSLYTLDGRMISNFEIQNETESYPISLTDGVYIVQIGNRNYKISK